MSYLLNIHFTSLKHPSQNSKNIFPLPWESLSYFKSNYRAHSIQVDKESWDQQKRPSVLCCNPCPLLPFLPHGVPDVPQTPWSEELGSKQWPLVHLSSSVLIVYCYRGKEEKVSPQLGSQTVYWDTHFLSGTSLRRRGWGRVISSFRHILSL